MKKKFIFLLVFSFFFRLLFSFYYNSQIIDQNTLLQQQTEKKQALLPQNQFLEQEKAEITSLEYLYPLISSKNLIPIKNSLKIPIN
ncbi:hypothetical protein KJ909_01385 [Patescibacteria group bacterium]|nr:hypothetical protein [Patescibacteria group bacterium]